MAVKIKWSNLLRIPELEFIPSPPTELKLTDELIQALSWLTGTTGYDRRLIRCDANGAILVAKPWTNLNSVEVDELHPDDGTPDSYTATVANKGVLIATSTQIVKIGIVWVSGGATENIYVPPDSFYWTGNSTYSITATVVPASGGTASYVGLTAFN